MKPGRSRRVLSWAALALLVLSGCDGDWLGPVERGARALFHGWDMWNTPAVRPYEDPIPPAVPGAVPMHGVGGLAAARAELEPLPAAQRRTFGQQAYRRYCRHCHGPSGDARIIVGESFGVPVTDLRGDDVQGMSDEELFELLTEGTTYMLPLAPTTTPAERLGAIEHMRTLRGAGSRPYFRPQYTEPIK